MKIEIDREDMRVTIKGTDGGAIAEQSVTAVLLYELLAELRTHRELVEKHLEIGEEAA